MKRFALLFLVACGSRTQLDDPESMAAPIGAYGGSKCAVTRATVLVPAPPQPKGIDGWFTISTLTPFHGRLYWTPPSFTSESDHDDHVPGTIASMPLGGGVPTTVVTTSVAAAWDATFVVDDEHITFVDGSLKQTPLAGGDASVIDEAFRLLGVTKGKNGFLVSGDEIGWVPSSTQALPNDAVTKNTRKLVDGGDALYGCSSAGFYRIDGGVATLLGTDDAADFVVDDHWIYYAIDGDFDPHRRIGARLPKAGGPPQYFFSKLPPNDALAIAQGVAQDDTRVYYGDRGAISAVTKATGEVTTVAEAVVDPKNAEVVSVAVDDDCVYWAHADNSIWASPKH